jgi:2-dehydro-3-deoxygluconokinase
MRAAWRAESIADHALLAAGRLPGLYTVETTPQGERAFSYWRHGSAAAHVFAGTDWVRHVRGDLIHLSGISLQLMSWLGRDALLTRLSNLRDGGARVSFDINYRARGWRSPAEAAAAIEQLCANADIVFAGRDDDEALHRPRAVTALVDHLHRLGVPEVVLRDGPAGAYVSAGCGVTHLPAQRVGRVVDTTAAGDAFSGAYLAARLAGAPPEQAAGVGNAVAAVVIGHPGALTPSGTPLTLQPSR